nr:DNA topoisomerase 2 [Tanacetum cinerariifolium]
MLGVNFEYIIRILHEAQHFLRYVVVKIGYNIPVSKEDAHTLGNKFKHFTVSEKWCLVTCQLNLAKFGMDCLEDDIVALIKRRVVDLAGCCLGVNVELDGTCDLPRMFQDYVRLYLQSSRTHNTMLAIADGHLEHFHQVSFVNSIATMKGGSHVDYITNQITDGLADMVGLPPDEIELPTLILHFNSNKRSFFHSFCTSHEELEENSDIQNIKKILGLQEDKIYENVNELRYGHLMIMTDEDLDGLETKGLLINFLHYFWPSLLKVKNVLRAFIAPFVRASHKETNKVLLFYSMPDYEEWKEKFGEEYNIKFYKGPKTIESEKRGEDTFDQHVKDFVWENDEDGHAIELPFSPMKIKERSRWLQTPQDGCDFNPTKKSIRYLDFINQEFKQYAIADIQRSIPSMVDGLKPHQRKILFYVFKKPIIQRTKVDHFTSYVLEHSPYNEGEASLVGTSTIIGMAQNFGGKDHADGTLRFTWLSPITRYIFHQDDELFLNYLNEDGQSIEPKWFIPIIPMVLVNGSEARGVWSSFIPNYNPRDVIANLIRLLDGEKMMAMLPWYRGFKGDIKETTTNHTSYTANGKILEDENALTITELPLRTWTKDYRKFLVEAASRKDVEDFFHIRLDFYNKRKTDLLRPLRIASLVLTNKLRFIKLVSDGNSDLVINFNTKDVKCAELEARGFPCLASIERKVDELQEVAADASDTTRYDYLLSINIQLLEVEDIEKLQQERDAKDEKIAYLKDTSIKDLWRADLQALDHQLALVRNEALSLLILQKCYQEWWPGRGGQEKTETKTNNAKTERSPIPGLNNEQYQQFLNIFLQRNTSVEDGIPIVANAIGKTCHHNDWIIDSGATENMTHRADWLKSKTKTTYELAKDLRCAVTFFPDFCVMQDLHTKKLIGVGKCVEGLYLMKIIGSERMVMMTTIAVWHKRLGHASHDKLSHLDFVKNTSS